MKAKYLFAALFAMSFTSAYAISFVSSDVDQDGYISKDEATVVGLSEVFEELDVDKDGKLSLTEFETIREQTEKHEG